MSDHDGRKCVQCGAYHWRQEPGLPLGLVPMSPLTPREGEKSPLCYRCAERMRREVKGHLRGPRGGPVGVSAPDSRLRHLERAAAADPGDLELAVALRTEQERLGVAPALTLLVAGWGGWLHYAHRSHGAGARYAVTFCDTIVEAGRLEVAEVPFAAVRPPCQPCSQRRAKAAGTPRDRVLLERQAAELARRLGVGAP